MYCKPSLQQLTLLAVMMLTPACTRASFEAAPAPVQVASCPSVAAYDLPTQAQAAADLERTPQASPIRGMMNDYHRLRGELAACAQVRAGGIR